MKNSAPSSLASPGRALRLAGLATLLGLGAAQAFAQAPNDPNAGRRRGGPDGGGRGGPDGGGRGTFSPEDMQARMLTALRDRLGVTDDEEWNLISKRIAAVTELRRNTAGGGGPGGILLGGGRGGPPGGGDTGGRGGRGPGGRGGSSNAEVAALQAAITDNLPEAEIKSRLERVRESRRDNEAKLVKAQEDLRALLSVKQEATAVLFGLLP
ncbi:MAG: hypothetical protein JNK23_18985 [Opitutaceae bacterium]|nr:hypothetical protein [Opitutaceae bacterium]